LSRAAWYPVLLCLASTLVVAAPASETLISQNATGPETAAQQAPSNAEESSGASAPARAAESIVREESWPGYNNGFDGQRYSSLSEINTRNVASLRRICTLRLGDEGAFETGPLVIDDTMYVTTARTTVALDAGRCTVRWRRARPSCTRPTAGPRRPSWRWCGPAPGPCW